MQFLILALVALLTPNLAAASTNCPGGYSDSVGNGNCYKHVTTPMIYSQANDTCNKDGARLVHIHNAFENTQLLANASSDMWIGLQCTGNTPSNCVWEDDGSNAASYSNFLREPDNSIGSCVMIYAGTGKWASEACDMEHVTFVCEYNAPLCEDGWTYINGSCFKVFLNSTACFYHSEAEDLCYANSAQLASVHSDYENNAIYDLASSLQNFTQIWIGLRRVGKTQTFEWIDGSAWDYSNWYRSQPDNVTTNNWGYICNGPTWPYDRLWEDSYDFKVPLVACKKPFAQHTKSQL